MDELNPNTAPPQQQPVQAQAIPQTPIQPQAAPQAIPQTPIQPQAVPQAIPQTPIQPQATPQATPPTPVQPQTAPQQIPQAPIANQTIASQQQLAYTQPNQQAEQIYPVPESELQETKVKLHKSLKIKIILIPIIIIATLVSGYSYIKYGLSKSTSVIEQAQVEPPVSKSELNKDTENTTTTIETKKTETITEPEISGGNEIEFSATIPENNDVTPTETPVEKKVTR